MNAINLLFVHDVSGASVETYTPEIFHRQEMVRRPVIGDMFQFGGHIYKTYQVVEDLENPAILVYVEALGASMAIAPVDLTGQF